MKKRFRSRKFWVALSAAVVVFATAVGKAFGVEVDGQVVESVLMGFCGVLSVLGIVEAPKEAQDDNKQGEENCDCQESRDENN